MTDKELRKLKRSEMLEMLISLKKENDELRSRLEQAEEQLNNRKIEIGQAGSIAEAALRLNEVFEAADRAAAQYLENIQQMAGKAADQYLEDVQQMAGKATNQYLESLHRMTEKAKGPAVDNESQ